MLVDVDVAVPVFVEDDVRDSVLVLLDDAVFVDEEVAVAVDLHRTRCMRLVSAC